jgi:1-deoxy-D-xylulose-5-phosphate synthase
MVVMAPRDEDQLRHMVATALARDDGPTAIRYQRGSGLGVACEGPALPLPIGKAEVLQSGEDLCLLAVGSMVEASRQAAAKLAVAGVAAEVVDMRFVKPLDAMLLADVWRRHRLVMTVEENALAGGFGAAVLEWAAAHAETGEPRVICLGIPDAFQDQATRAELLADLGLDGDGICARALGAWQQRSARADARDAC